MTDASALAGFAERRTTVRGVDVRYFVGGDGSSVVLVHGLGGAARTWLGVAPALAERHRVIVPDLPGHGGSAGIPALPNLAPFADVVHRVAERENALPATVAGHSLGGVVAVRHAVRYGADTRAIALLGSAGISSSTRRTEAVLAVTSLLQPGRRLAPLASWLSATSFRRRLVFGGWGATDAAALPPAYVRALLADVPLHTDVPGASRALVRDDVRHLLPAVRCPSVVAWGARDVQVPVDDAFAYARGLRAELRLIADCGHLLIVERPEACVDAILAAARA
ncbi:MAG: alpha/beta fold hydrolase [Gaiellaceae bacterium]